MIGSASRPITVHMACVVLERREERWEGKWEGREGK